MVVVLVAVAVTAAAAVVEAADGRLVGQRARPAISWLATPSAGETSVFRSLALINI